MPDLAAILLKLRPTHQDEIPAWLGYASMAWYLKTLKAIEPALSSAIHDGDGLKPFTVSNLTPDRGTASPYRELLRLRPTQTYWLRITTFHPDLTQITLNGLIPRWQEDGVDMHDQPMRVEQVIIDPTLDPWAGTQTYSDLQAQHQAAMGRGGTSYRQIAFQFLSPTAFKKDGGAQQIPLPIPELVFDSLINRWNEFSNRPLPAEYKDFIRECIVVSKFGIESQRISLDRLNRGGIGVVGFTGHVTFALQSSDNDWLNLTHMLAEFALYSGVGARTTTGFGQTRVYAL